MIRTILLPFVLVMMITIHAQDMPQERRAYLEKFTEGPVLSPRDETFLLSLPELRVPEGLNRTTLPAVVDNSDLPFLRPVFGQDGPSCGQAAMVGYNFTYEMNCARNLPSDVPENQYPTHFTWNFQNGGEGWYGVSYFHSIEMLRTCGNMNVLEYGGLYDDGRRWINGYDVYLSGMHNRIRGSYSIHTGTEEGILALKYWLNDHMGEQEHGGVASYYANVPWNAQILNDTTPEGGKHVMTEWWPEATHAMTIVGYNDSIRWDYNGDGQYTNDVDLNGDQVIDPRDWELGAVKFVNSHGLDAQDSGFCYMMYKCLSETFENGGVWNQSVHVLDVNPDYTPALSYKVTLKHNYRGKLKVMAGISADTSDLLPAFILDFPILNFQGGNHYLQGAETADSLQCLEFGLDVTPLLSHLEPGSPAKYFLVVDEDDDYAEGSGEILAFSLINHENGGQETPSVDVPAELEQDNRTLASLIQTVSFSKATITDGELPVFTEGVPYSFQLAASGGTPPYSWELARNFTAEACLADFPEVSAVTLMPNPQGDTLVAVPLDFSFPFYGTIYDTVFVHTDGHLQFDTRQLPWPYLLEHDLHLRKNRMIAPMTHDYFTIRAADGDGAWYESTDSGAVFRWQLSWGPKAASTGLNFAVRISADGAIRFYYGNSTLGQVSWVSGISSGNGHDFVPGPFSGSRNLPPGSAATFLPAPEPGWLNISGGGLLGGTPGTDTLIHDVQVRLTDDRGISTNRTFALTAGPVIAFVIHAGPDSMISFGDTLVFDAIIKNEGNTVISGSELKLHCQDPWTEVSDSMEYAGDILPGEEITLPGAFTMHVSMNIPDRHELRLAARLTSPEGNNTRNFTLMASAPDLQIHSVSIDDGDDGILDPGENASMIVELQNLGHAGIHGIIAQVQSLSANLQVTGSPAYSCGDLGKGAIASAVFSLHADESTPCGFPADLLFSTISQEGLTTADTIPMRIGRIPAMVIDMDPVFHSGPVIYDMLQELGVISDYDVGFPSRTDQYSTLFICLGYQNFNHVLTWQEGEVLAAFLDNGGQIYMEGRKTWKDDPWTPVHDKFYITYTGSATIFDTIEGHAATFTDGISLVNGATTPFSFYYLQPLSSAFGILHDNDDPVKTCAVANITDNYRTIGSLFELGTLEDLPPSTRQELMTRYLDFFGIYYTLTDVEEPPDPSPKTNGPALRIQVSPNPARSLLQVDITDREGVNGPSAFDISIIDFSGRNLMTLNGIGDMPVVLNISGLPDGIYIARAIAKDGKTATAKFIKQSP